MGKTGWTLALAATLAAAGCDNGNPLQVAAGPGGQLVVSVSGGVTPTYAWDGGRARGLAVRSGGGELFWQLEALDGSGFEGPVRHGATPAGARSVATARILEAGTVYTVTVTGVNGAQGSRSFTPAAAGGS